ncbi:GlsB/YeaQ/YmgE family stress response membrane protein [Luteolibacter pohnpeiensis]|uniref:GlsB/YeaQ/YmgE family stress response membrane protein n=1 Tax=Luteolibacter pohnpeiensis TaxID=454153 RepID=A0A934S4R6_9BACT|nr:GlsB/YeaQ/YmgE family stress response membrane protein [Luteolibacter pohnpeiensis]MBK1881205.1 GlsB/YeaQ/YmgE family stress response membrane protein [Luteolibacter pohnpeiensis]
MNLEQLIVFLLIGGIAGWLAGLISRGGSFSLLGNVIVGVLGALFGGWLFGVLGISIGGQWLGPLVTATVGALILLFLLRLIRKKK